VPSARPGCAQRADLLLRLRREVDQVLLQEAEHAVQRAVNLLNAFVVQRLRDNARDAGVNDGSGPPDWPTKTFPTSSDMTVLV